MRTSKEKRHIFDVENKRYQQFLFLLPSIHPISSSRVHIPRPISHYFLHFSQHHAPRDILKFPLFSRRSIDSSGRADIWVVLKCKWGWGEVTGVRDCSETNNAVVDHLQTGALMGVSKTPQLRVYLWQSLLTFPRACIWPPSALFWKKCSCRTSFCSRQYMCGWCARCYIVELQYCFLSPRWNVLLLCFHQHSWCVRLEMCTQSDEQHFKSENVLPDYYSWYCLRSFWPFLPLACCCRSFLGVNVKRLFIQIV